MESNTASDSRYAKLRPDTRSPHLEAQRYHLEDMDYAEDSDHELTPTVLKESEKVAIIHSLGRAVLQIVLHLVPVGLTFSILQLSFREIYWRGVGSDGSGYFRRYSINQALSMLQIVAKAHEVLIVIVSVSERFLATSFLSRECKKLWEPLQSHSFLLFSHPLRQLILFTFISFIFESGKRISVLSSLKNERTLRCFSDQNSIVCFEHLEASA